MKAPPLEGRVRDVLKLAPMTGRMIACCLCASRGAVDHCLDRLRASGEVTREPMKPRNTRVVYLWRVNA